jgi:diguanylate cyclase (GGDEF)-like protein/PAS domain S-box-containing protein
MSKELILVVDDSHQTADFTAKNILPKLGYNAITAYNGRAALRVIREKHQQLSLMLLDLQMPDLSGLDILRQVKDEGINVPAIMVTAHGSEQIIADAFRLGVYDYLSKPVDVDKLNEAITRALTETRLRQEKTKLAVRLQDQVSWLTALSDVGRSVTSTLDINTVLRRILEAGVSLTDAEQGFIALLDPSNERLYLRAVKNIEEEKIDTFRLPVNDPLVKQALETTRPVRKTRPSGGNDLKVSTGLLVYSLIHVPIIYQGSPLGVLSVNNHMKLKHFGKNDESVLMSLADYAAIALVNAGSFEKAQQEIEERKRIETALRESDERYTLAVRGSNDGLWDWNLQTNQIYYSPRWKEMLGYQEEEFTTSPDEWFSRIFEGDRERTIRDISTHLHKKTSHFINEHRLRHKDGTYRWALCRGMAVWKDNLGAVRIAGSISDITDRKKAEERLLHDALHDALTGLPNRTLFMDRLNHTIERAKRKEHYLFAVLFLDLDNFKDINDSIGHLVGDQALVKVASNLQGGLRSTDTLARFGGDEFIILLDEITDINGVIRVTDWIKEQFLKPIEVDDHEITTSTSIGVFLSQSEHKTAEDIIRNADIAMYEAKARGRARAEIYDPSMRQRFLKRLNTESALRKAISNNELRVYYQPIVVLQNGKLVGFEALVRWQHPEKGLLLPGDFINIAEETGIITDIDRWVLGEACNQVMIWNQRFKPEQDYEISINISARHITNPELHNYIKHVLNETGLNPNNLKLEITELTIIDQNEFTTRSLANLQNMGIQIQIDDFGIGYSSLAYLSQFPINALKIDQSFISGLLAKSSQREIVEAIVGLSKSLDVNVIAEGVETQEQLKELISLGCKLGQGYLVSYPLESSKIETLLEKIIIGNEDLTNLIIEDSTTDPQ